MTNDATGAAPIVDLGDHSTLASRPAVVVPTYDRTALRRSIVHLGVGAFHRSHFASYVDELCAAGERGWSIVGAGLRDVDRPTASALASQGGLYTLVERGHAATLVRVIGSLVEYVYAADHQAALIARLASPEVAIVSLTITEGGYPVDHDGSFDPGVDALVFDVIVEALDRRRANGDPPFTVVSFDNVVRNGDTTRTATLGAAGRRSDSLASWIEQRGAFPNSMVDRITPSTTDADRRWLREMHAVVDRAPVFAEPFRQWAIEDTFADTRPPLERLDVVLTSDVEPFETLKLRMLNAAHSCLAYLAFLHGFVRVDEAMADPVFRAFTTGLLRDEVRPVLPPTPGIDQDRYIVDILRRFSNPAIGDQIARLCLDGSSKFPKFLLPTIRAQLRDDGRIRLATLALAGWCRYLSGVTGDGTRFTPANDPRLSELTPLARAARDNPRAFISYEPVFGPDLHTAPRFAAEFARSLSSLDALPVRSAVATAIEGDTHDGETRSQR